MTRTRNQPPGREEKRGKSHQPRAGDPPPRLATSRAVNRSNAFGHDGHVLSQAEQIALWKKKGLCTECGQVQTHDRGKGLGRLIQRKLTVAGLVYKGICLECHDIEHARRLAGEKVLVPVAEDDDGEAHNKIRRRKLRHRNSVARDRTQTMRELQSRPKEVQRPPNDAAPASPGNGEFQPPITEIEISPGSPERMMVHFPSVSSLGIGGVSCIGIDPPAPMPPKSFADPMDAGIEPAVVATREAAAVAAVAAAASHYRHQNSAGSNSRTGGSGSSGSGEVYNRSSSNGSDGHHRTGSGEMNGIGQTNASHASPGGQLRSNSAFGPVGTSHTRAAAPKIPAIGTNCLLDDVKVRNSPHAKQPGAVHSSGAVTYWTKSLIAAMPALPKIIDDDSADNGEQGNKPKSALSLESGDKKPPAHSGPRVSFAHSGSVTSSVTASTTPSNRELEVVKTISDQCATRDYNAILETMRSNSGMAGVVREGCICLRRGVSESLKQASSTRSIKSSEAPAAALKGDNAQRRQSATLCRYFALPPGWAKILVSIISDFLGDALIQSEGLLTLWAVSAASARYVNDLTSSGGVEAILAALDHHKNDAHVLVRGCGTLACLTESERHCRTVRTQGRGGRDGGVVGRMIQILKGAEELPKEWALRVLCNLSVHCAAVSLSSSSLVDQRRQQQQRVADEIQNADATRVIVNTIQNHENNAAVAEWGIRLLWCLSAPPLRSAEEEGSSVASSASTIVAASLGTVSAVKNVMNIHRNVVSVQDAALGLLSNLAIPPVSAAGIAPSVARPIAEALRDSMMAHPKSSDLQVSGLCAIVNLCSTQGTSAEANTENRATVAQLGGITLALDAMYAFPDDPQVQSAGCLALASLCAETEQNKRSVVASGGIEPIKIAFRKHVVNKGGFVSDEVEAAVRDGACAALSSLAASPDTFSELESSGVLEDVAAVMRKHNGCAAMDPALRSAVEKMLVTSSLAIEQGMPSNDASIIMDRIDMASCIEEAEEAIKSLHHFSLECSEFVGAIASPAAGGGNGLDLVLNLMRVFSDSSEVQQRGCDTLSNLYFAANQNNAVGACEATASIHTAKVVEAINGAMRSDPDCAAVRECACTALRNFCASFPSPLALDGDVASMLIVAVNLVVDSLTYHRSSLPVQESACGVFWAVSSLSDELSLATGSSQAIQRIIEAMVAFPNSDLLQDEALSALLTLSTLHDNFRAIGTERGIDAILECMRRYDEKESMVEKGCNIIAALSADAYHVKSTIVENEDSIHRIIDSMYRYPASTPIQKAACTAIANLSVENFVKDDIANQGGVDRVVSCMQDHLADESFQEKACLALCNLISGVQNDILSGNDVISHLNTSMNQHMGSAEIQEKGMEALWNLSIKGDWFKSQIVKSRCVITIVDAMSRHLASACVQEKGCVVLWSLAIRTEFQQEIADVGGVAAVLNGMLAHITEASVQREALGALKTMATGIYCKNVINKCNGVDAVVWSMWANMDSAHIQAAACTALTNISVNTQTHEVAVVEHHELEAITSAMGYFSSSVDVQTSACLLLRNYTFAPSNIPLMRANLQLRHLLTNAKNSFPQQCGARATYVLDTL